MVSITFIFGTCSPSSVSAQTRAGNSVFNTATLSYNALGADVVVPSNRATIIVAELLDVALSRRGSEPVTPATTAISFLLLNRGNGEEAFQLSATDDRGTPPTVFAIDGDGDGRYDPAHDPLLTDAASPPLAPGASLPLLLLGDVAGQFDGTQTVITARAATGYGAPGTTYAGRGDGGGDAVVGRTGAQAQLTVPLIGQNAQGALTKTQSVLAPDGSTRPVRGAIVTYTLSASVPAPSTVVRIDDPIPAGTIYVPGSLLLDGVALSDAADGDAGTADGATISVSLGSPAEPAIRTIQFEVRIP